QQKRLSPPGPHRILQHKENICRQGILMPYDGEYEGGSPMSAQAFKPKLVYVYDALCPWCYAFTPVVEALCDHFGDRLDHEVISGGMVRGDQVREIGGEEEAACLRESYRSIESLTGVR